MGARPSVDFATHGFAEVAARGKGINAMESRGYLTLWSKGVEVDPLLDVEVDPLYEVEISTLSPLKTRPSPSQADRLEVNNADSISKVQEHYIVTPT